VCVVYSVHLLEEIPASLVTFAPGRECCGGLFLFSKNPFPFSHSRLALNVMRQAFATSLFFVGCPPAPVLLDSKFILSLPRLQSLTGSLRLPGMALGFLDHFSRYPIHPLTIGSSLYK